MFFMSYVFRCDHMSKVFSSLESHKNDTNIETNYVYVKVCMVLETYGVSNDLTYFCKFNLVFFFFLI